MLKQLSAAALAVSLGLGTANASMLYKVSGNGMEEPSYLFGTIHIICQSDFKVDDATTAAFNEADRIVLELDMDDPAVMQSMQSKVLSPGGEKISSYLDDDQQTLLDNFLTSNIGANLQAVDNLRPFIISTMVMSSQMGCAQQVSYEGYFVQQAMAQEKQLDGLETVDFQMGVFEQIPHDEQVSWLIESLEQPEQAKKDLKRMLDAYLAADVEGLYNLFSEYEAYSEYKALMLDNRNYDWQQKLDQQLQAPGSEFIAVGAGHLGGKAGMINLLKESGYTVEAVAQN
ncbi:TraB/GumN family protein [Pseudidiomarina sediminum]|nr:TraB/GumN family protein [Pseudidiomarina sediminum]